MYDIERSDAWFDASNSGNTWASVLWSHSACEKYLASITNTSNSTGSGSIRNFELGRVADADLIYDKNLIAKFLSQQWNRRLRADGSLLFKNNNVQVETLEMIGSPYITIRRFENRRNNVQCIDFIHGRLARFMDFRKK